MDDYLSKPVKQKELEQVLDRWLSGPDDSLLVSLNSAADSLHQSAADADQIFDELEILGRLGDNQELLQEIIGMACADLPVRLQQMQQALISEDRAALRQAAHTIKGMAANLSAYRLQQVASQLEDKTESATFSQLQLLVTQVAEQVIVLVELLTKKQATV